MTLSNNEQRSGSVYFYFDLYCRLSQIKMSSTRSLYSYSLYFFIFTLSYKEAFDFIQKRVQFFKMFPKVEIGNIVELFSTF